MQQKMNPMVAIGHVAEDAVVHALVVVDMVVLVAVRVVAEAVKVHAAHLVQVMHFNLLDE